MIARRRSWRWLSGRVVFTVATALWLAPIMLAVTLSFRSNTAIDLSPLGRPNVAYLQNYVVAWNTGDMPTALATSAVIVVVVWAWLVSAGAAGSYYVSRRGGWLARISFSVILVGVMVPYVARVFPLYRLMAEIGLAGNPLSVVIFQAGALTPVSVLLYRSFLRRVPRDYEEAAAVEGATRWQTMRYVVLPQLRPATGAVMGITGMIMWNDFFTPLLLLNGSRYETIPVRLFAFVGQYTTEWGEIFAMLVMGAVPVVALFLALQKYLIAGLGSGVTG